MVLKNVGVTGASGLLGQHLLKHLDDRGINYACLSRTQPRHLSVGQTWSRCDFSTVLDTEMLDLCFGNTDAIIHLGAMVPSQFETGPDANMFEVNVRATLDIGRWALRQQIPMVFMSSSSIYVDPTAPNFSEDAPCSARSIAGFYGTTKYLAEETLNALEGMGLALIVFRPSSIYGVGMPKQKMLPSLLAVARRGETINLIPPYEDRINLIHAADVAHAILDAIQANVRGVFNIADTCCRTIVEIANAAVWAAGSGTLAKTTEHDVGQASSRYDLNIGKARKAFGFEPSMTLEDGLRHMFTEQA